MSTPKEFFIVLNHQKDSVKIPVMDEYNSLHLFETEKDAERHASGIQLAKWYGSEVFCLGWGV